MGIEVKDEEERVSIEDGIIKYDIDTEPGQSGSPILMKEKNCYYVIGLHVSAYNDKYNKGILITEERLEKINSWILENLKKKINKNSLSNTEFKQLEKLDLKNQNIGIKGMEILSKSNFQNLKELDLSQNCIQKQGFHYLLKTNLKNLKKLFLKQNEINYDYLLFFKDKNILNGLEVLDLSDNNISIKAMKILSSLQLINLKILNFNSNGVRNEGLKHLCESQTNFKKLEELYIENTLITRKGIEYFKKMNLKIYKKINYSNRLKVEIGNKIKCAIFTEIK